jgi:hypothetical protein
MMILSFSISSQNGTLYRFIDYNKAIYRYIPYTTYQLVGCKKTKNVNVGTGAGLGKVGALALSCWPNTTYICFVTHHMLI